jgi:hypothetical protein
MTKESSESVMGASTVSRKQFPIRMSVELANYYTRCETALKQIANMRASEHRYDGLKGAANMQQIAQDVIASTPAGAVAPVGTSRYTELANERMALIKAAQAAGAIEKKTTLGNWRRMRVVKNEVDTIKQDRGGNLWRSLRVYGVNGIVLQAVKEVI